MGRKLVRAAAAIALAVAFGQANAIPAIWEPSFGSTVLTGDDATTSTSWGFVFPFLGSSYTGGEISTNGFMSLGGSNSNGCCDASTSSLLSGADRIAVAWYDLNTTGGSSIRQNTFADHVVITWDNVPEFSNSLGNTFQMQLFNTGRIIFGYDVLHPNADSGHRHHGLTGISGGGGVADPGEIDYTTALPFNSSSDTVYEFFARGPNGSTAVGGDTWDLAGTNICYDPRAGNTWHVTTSCSAPVPEPSVLALVGIALVGFGATRRRRAVR